MALDDLIKYIDPERLGEFQAAYENEQEKLKPHIPAAARAGGARIVRNDGPKPSNAQLFAEFMRERNWR